MHHKKNFKGSTSRTTSLFTSLLLLISLMPLKALSAPVLSVYSELYYDTVSEDISGNEINFDSGSLVNNQDVLGPMEVFSRTDSIDSNLPNEYWESLYAESYIAFYLDSSASNSYEVTMEFSYDAPSNQNAFTNFVESEHNGTITDLTQSSPISEFYTFEISPDEIVEHLWVFEIVGVEQFSLSAVSSLNVIAFNEILPTEVSEPSSLAILLLSSLGLLLFRKRV